LLYRKFGKTKREVSVLGFGCMRLPLLQEGDQSSIDFGKAKEMVRYAIDKGVNYIDTAYPYHGGKSEIFVAEALKDGYREKVYLATKLPSWLVRSREDMDRLLGEQLEKLQTDYIDFYLVHSLHKETWSTLKECGVFDFLDKALASGKIKYAGFSFHDDLATFKEIVDAYDWSFCQIQYNYMDEKHQAGTEGMEYAAAKGLGIVIMEPVRGGALAGPKVPPQVKQLFAEYETKKSAAAWALRWVWNHPEVSVALSGMSTFEQVAENVATAGKGLADSLGPEDLALIDKARQIYNSKVKVPCTGCAYCMPCPNGLNIPGCFTLYNNYAVFGSRWQYDSDLDESEKAHNCIECGLCEEACPQAIPIRQKLKEIAVAMSR
jgi:predicted aldo/keto reductase-like oxidoreductase